MEKEKLYTQNSQLFDEAKKYLIGGVNSPVRSFQAVGGDALCIKKAKGPIVWDYDDNSYVDYVLSFGAHILGHAHPDVVRRVQEVSAYGFSYGATHESEVELARIICEAIPFIERIRFVNSGTEAVMGAIRLARGITDRDKIIKFTNSYHGHADYLLAKSGSGLATLQIPLSRGVPEDFIKHTIVLDYGNVKVVEDVFKKYGEQIAAVIVEPVGGNFGVVEPDREFLQYLRKVTQRYRSFLIFDEVITGFRFSFGSFAQSITLEPDLICLGKIIGGGLPVGAYAGFSDYMEQLSPHGDIYQASTFAGNPIVMQAGVTTLALLKEQQNTYLHMNRLAENLVQGIRESARMHGVDVELQYYGSMFSMRFKQKTLFKRFYRSMLKEGMYLPPSEFEAIFLSFSHGEEEIERTLKAADNTFKNIYRGS